MSPRPPAEATGIGFVSGGRLQLNRSVAQDGAHSARWMQETTDQKVVCSNHAGCIGSAQASYGDPVEQVKIYLRHFFATFAAFLCVERYASCKCLQG
jgi:hypothetical protein